MLPPPAGSTLRVTIHRRDFSDYRTLSKYLRETYPAQHSQLWDQIFRTHSFLIALMAQLIQVL